MGSSAGTGARSQSRRLRSSRPWRARARGGARARPHGPGDGAEVEVEARMGCSRRGAGAFGTLMQARGSCHAAFSDDRTADPGRLRIDSSSAPNRPLNGFESTAERPEIDSELSPNRPREGSTRGGWRRSGRKPSAAAPPHHGAPGGRIAGRTWKQAERTWKQRDAVEGARAQLCGRSGRSGRHPWARCRRLVG